MNRIDEMIYHLDAMAKTFEHSMAARDQSVEGQERLACIMCGYCPSAEVEWLRAIRDELTGEHPTLTRAS